MDYKLKDVIRFTETYAALYGFTRVLELLPAIDERLRPELEKEMIKVFPILLGEYKSLPLEVRKGMKGIPEEKVSDLERRVKEL